MRIPSSEKLRVGQLYSRKDLADRFGITDATLYTGVFQPEGHSSVWLFITEEKTPDRTPYQDSLVGDDLHWDGQLKGRTDDLIIHHESQGIELLVFHRSRKDQHPQYAFRYEGPFRYVSHEGLNPTAFHLRRIGG